ncbi:Deoxyribonuclease-2-alpha, partial [Trichinella nativa]
MFAFFNVLALFLFINLLYSQTTNCQNRAGNAVADWTIVYKAPGQATGKIIEATAAAGNWQDGAALIANDQGHSFATALQHVVRENQNVKFLAYNNAPPGVPSIKTKSNSKGVIILSTTTDSAAWIVHTVPGFPAAKTGYSWPLAENARGHLLICLTILESQINAIAASLLLVQPLIHYNDIPKTETAAMPYFNKLAEGKIPTLPPFTSRQTIQSSKYGEHELIFHSSFRTVFSKLFHAIAPLRVYVENYHDFLEIYKKVIVKALKKTIKVWSRRDSKLKGDCRVSQRHIRLIKSPAVVVDHNTNLEADITNWAVSDPGNIFCHIDKPYFKNQTREPAMAICIDNINIFTRFDAIAAQLEDWHDINTSINLFNYEEKMLKFSELLALFFFIKFSHSQTSKCQDKPGNAAADWAIVYKAPGQDTARSWDNGASAFTNNAGHSFAKTLEDVVRDHINIKFLAYNNAPPGVSNVNTKSNSKGLIILSTAADSAAWIVHTVPGFPTARTPYSWPAAENARGHLLICLTISESQINAIAASLLLVQPMVHYNDIPETETAGMPYFNKLAEGKIPTVPPFTSRRSIRTENARSPVAVHIYSKSESSKYVLKKTIKVWSRRDSKLKGDCRVSERHIRLIKSPAAINGHNTNLEADITNWAVSDPGNIFCHIDKPYFKNQTREPAMACSFSQIYRILKHQNVRIKMVMVTTIVYKAPGQPNGKIILSTAAVSWDDGAQALSSDNRHSFATALQHVVRDDGNIKFLAYNNAPPGVANVKTKSNSKGVIILATNADSAAWIVHTVPGFPAAKTGYNWPLAENARGHLLICLTISESQINAIAASLLLVQPLIHYNDIPKTETAGMPSFNKLAEGKIPTLPPFTSRQTIRTQDAGN